MSHPRGAVYALAYIEKTKQKCPIRYFKHDFFGLCSQGYQQAFFQGRQTVSRNMGLEFGVT